MRHDNKYMISTHAEKLNTLWIACVSRVQTWIKLCWFYLCICIYATLLSKVTYIAFVTHFIRWWIQPMTLAFLTSKWENIFARELYMYVILWKWLFLKKHTVIYKFTEFIVLIKREYVKYFIQIISKFFTHFLKYYIFYVLFMVAKHTHFKTSWCWCTLTVLTETSNEVNFCQSSVCSLTGSGLESQCLVNHITCLFNDLVLASCYWKQDTVDI